MKNYEFVFKNWDKEVKIGLYYQRTNVTIGNLARVPLGLCFCIKREVCDGKCCKDCIGEWLNEEATKENNLYIDYVQED